MPAPPRHRARAEGPVRVLTGSLAVAALVALGGCGAGDTPPTPEATVSPATPLAESPAPPTPTPDSAPPDTAAPAPSPTLDPGPALESATWGEREGGRSLVVVPAAWVRGSTDLAAVDALWAEVLAVHPDADTPGMYDQLVCHAVGAPDKDTWNLEPWRPDVGLLAVMQARCNPR